MTPTTRRPTPDRGRALTLLAVLVAGVVLAPLVLPPVFIAGAVLIPLAVLLLAGLGTWWLVSGQGAGGGTGEVLRHSALGLGVLVGCSVIAAVGAWAAGIGGAPVGAALVIAAGLVLVVAGFTGRARRLILPALALAVPVAFVSAAGIDLRGGVGSHGYRPTSAGGLRDRYKLGAGRLVVDLRGARLPAGDTPLSLDVGVGQALLLVPRDVCVATRSRIGMGAVQVFDRVDGGADVDQADTPPTRPTTSRLVVDARVGLGAFQVGNRELSRHRFGPDPRHRFGDFDVGTNVGCAPGRGGAVAPAS